MDMVHLESSLSSTNGKLVLDLLQFEREEPKVFNQHN